LFTFKSFPKLQFDPTTTAGGGSRSATPKIPPLPASEIANLAASRKRHCKSLLSYPTA
jgi:hypothetical protein